MKKLLFSFALVMAVTLVVSAQYPAERYSYIKNVLPGVWKWTAYSGGQEQTPSKEATDNYRFTLRLPEDGGGLFFYCDVFKNDAFLYSTQVRVTENPTNHLFPYTLHYDITAPLMNGAGAAMPSINFRIAEQNILEFSNGLKSGYRYVFKNVSETEGC